MKRFQTLAALVAVLIRSGSAATQEIVHFPSLEDNGPGQAATMLDGYLYRVPGEARHPAVVGLHGCGGMFSRTTGLITPIYREWAAELNRQGYTVLLVDSFRPRNHGEMCSIQGFDFALYRKRPRDAYGALWFLQAQPFVRGDRIALAGWSQGGGATLFSIAAQSLGIGDRIHFHGFVPDEDLELLFAQTHLFLMPAVQGYGIPAIESLQRGIPVLLHRESGVSDILLDTPWATVLTGGEENMTPALQSAIEGILQSRHHAVSQPHLPTEDEWAERVATLCNWL